MQNAKKFFYGYHDDLLLTADYLEDQGTIGAEVLRKLAMDTTKQKPVATIYLGFGIGKPPKGRIAWMRSYTAPKGWPKSVGDEWSKLDPVAFQATLKLFVELEEPYKPVRMFAEDDWFANYEYREWCKMHGDLYRYCPKKEFRDGEIIIP